MFPSAQCIQYDARAFSAPWRDAQHIYGGISPAMVLEERVVRRAADGTYLSIDGLVEGPPSDGGAAATPSSTMLAVTATVAVAAAAALAFMRRA